MYRNKVIHRDLKPENVLFNEDHTVVKIIDMGISSEFNTKSDTMYVGEAGTFRYMSPE